MIKQGSCTRISFLILFESEGSRYVPPSALTPALTEYPPATFWVTLTIGGTEPSGLLVTHVRLASVATSIPMPGASLLNKTKDDHSYIEGCTS